MKVAAYQAPLLGSGSMAAVGLIAAQVRACEAAGVSVLCCPEAVLGGLADDSRQPNEIAIDVPTGRLQAVLAPMASRTVTTIVGFTESGPDGKLFNSAAIFSGGEVVGVYRKRHPAINRSVYEPGTDTPVFTVRDLPFGIVICLDSRFPDLARTMGCAGATVLFIPTNNALAPKKGGVELVEWARDIDIRLARENGLAVIRADVAGALDGLVCHGSSGIVDRHGIVLQAATLLEPGLLVAEIEA